MQHDIIPSAERDAIIMSIYYQADVHITKQEDGLWRLYVPDLKRAWVDTN